MVLRAGLAKGYPTADRIVGKCFKNRLQKPQRKVNQRGRPPRHACHSRRSWW